MSSIVTVVQPAGILSGAQADRFKQEVSSIVDSGVNNILIDFKNVTFMDSSGLGALVVALKMVKTAGGTLSLCSLSNEIRILLEIADVEQFFEIVNSQDS